MSDVGFVPNDFKVIDPFSCDAVIIHAFIYTVASDSVICSDGAIWISVVARMNSFVIVYV